MRLFAAIVILVTVLLLSSGALALRTFSGDVVNIDTAIDDDVFAAGNMVNINAPVGSAVVAGGNVNINAPVKGDVFAAGGQVNLNSDVGGKLVTAGGNINLGGGIGTNLVAAGGTVDILPGKTVGRDALIGGSRVINSGHVNGTLMVSATSFDNTGSAGKVDFRKTETFREDDKREAAGAFGFFGLLMLVGYFILGLILLRFLPGIFSEVNEEIERSPLVATVVGFVMIISSFIAILIVGITVVGLPIALIATLLLIAVLMLTGTFVAYALGKWIGARLKLKYSDLVLFVIGFVILNILFAIPFVGWLASLISVSLGFGAILYACRKHLDLARTA
ncbi:MAG: hypothetical protein A4E48_00335 [Methanosaeta sp. PtaU1.Bin060]|jgi:hypothetical protein|nr:MAG: hypothetical protein A4E48_00335 [Methanosaeta sp. PtaU1.Bin060]